MTRSFFFVFFKGGGGGGGSTVDFNNIVLKVCSLPASRFQFDSVTQSLT